MGYMTIENNGATEQFNGREGETATLYERRSLNSNGLGGGFAPRHLSRSTAVFTVPARRKEQAEFCSAAVRPFLFRVLQT